MRERVNVIKGKNPILLVVPHGADDMNTNIIGQKAAELCDCNAVINQGFDRADKVDPDNDMADCNRVDHAESDIVYDEFLKPILKIKEHFVGQHPVTYNDEDEAPSSMLTILHIHGAGDIVHKEAGKHVDVIIGYGLGKESHSFTCKKWRRNVFIDAWRKTKSNGIYEGQGGGKYAGRSSNNMNQYFRKHELDRAVESMQLEFPYSERRTEDDAEETALSLARVIMTYLKSPVETESLANLVLPQQFI